MKRTILILLLVICRIVSFSQTAFTLSGKIAGTPNAYIYIKIDYIDSNGKRTTDSCLLVNNTFSFKGNIIEPTKAGLSLGKMSMVIFLEPGNITAEGNYFHFNYLKLYGSKTQDEYQFLQVQLDIINKQFEPILNKFYEYSAAKKNSRSQKVLDSLTEKMDSVIKAREPLAAKYENTVRRFVTTHPNSYVSPFEMNVYAVLWPLDSVKNIYHSFSPIVQNSFYGTLIRKTIDKRDKELLETVAKDFNATDINGKPLSLSDFKGKYVLIDFWASWCVPCREGTPHMLGLFKQYKNSGLDIVAISVDKDKDAWIKAVNKDDMLAWHNMLASSDKAGSTEGRFGIHVFPTKILIDPTGIVIGRFTGTEDTSALDQKLAQLFKH